VTVLRNLAFAGNNSSFKELEKLEARYSRALQRFDRASPHSPRQADHQRQSAG
jgi:hypothetical protein